MANYVEEKEFNLRLLVRYSFPEDYQGEDDGYEWLTKFKPLVQDVVQAAVKAIGARGGWTVRAANRGRSAEDEVTLVVEHVAEVA